MKEAEKKIAIAVKKPTITAIKKRKSICTYQPGRIIPEKKKIFPGDLYALGSAPYRFGWFAQVPRDILAERIDHVE